MKVTAELRSWSREQLGEIKYAKGTIYDDTKERWKDGTRIHTSYIREVKDQGDHYLIFTRNSLYKAMKNQEIQGNLKISKSG